MIKILQNYLLAKLNKIKNNSNQESKEDGRISFKYNY